MEDRSSVRSDSDTILNTPRIITVGRGERIKNAEIREPNNREFREQFATLGIVISNLINKNASLLQKIFGSGKEIEAEDIEGIDLSSIPDGFNDLIAHLVGEDLEFVDEYMGPQQTVEVLEAYFDLLGWSLIKKAFFRALEKFRTAETTATGNSKKPEMQMPPFAEHSS